MTATDMTMTDLETTAVIGGADTHAETIHVAAIDAVGRDLGRVSLVQS